MVIYMYPKLQFYSVFIHYTAKLLRGQLYILVIINLEQFLQVLGIKKVK